MPGAAPLVFEFDGLRVALRFDDAQAREVRAWEWQGEVHPAVDPAQFPGLRDMWCRRLELPLVVVSYPAAASGLLAFPVLWLATVGVRRVRASARRTSGRCPGCGYDLRATPGRCLECGTAAAKEASPAAPPG